MAAILPPPASRLAEVLTLQEAATYLRLSPKVVVQQAVAGKLPGQRVDAQTWTFRQSEIEHWSRCCDQRRVLLRQAGAFAHDETLDVLQAAVDYERRQSVVAGND